MRWGNDMWEVIRGLPPVVPRLFSVVLPGCSDLTLFVRPRHLDRYGLVDSRPQAADLEH